MSEKSNARVPEWVPKSRLLQDPAPKVRPDFRPAFLDFRRGIRMGNLEPNQRITRILKAALEERHGTRFITDRWGRGVYWKWICWLPVENRRAKPLSSGYNFGCAKYYVTLDRERETFEAGMQVERAPTRAGVSHARLREDWDFHALLRGLRRGTPLARQVSRLVRGEGFTVRAGAFAAGGRRAYGQGNYPGPAALARALRAIPPESWGGLQLCYVFTREDIRNMTGAEIVSAVRAILDELGPAMNLVMTVPCLRAPEPS